MRRRRLLLLLIGALLTACNGRGESWERIVSAGTLRVGLDPTYPPFENADSGTLEGLDVDLARALGEELGLAIDFVYFGYDGLYDALGTGQVDMLLSALVVAPERTRDFAYSESYFDAGQILVSPREAPVDEMAELNGRTLAVELGAEGHVIATTWQRRLADFNVITRNAPDEALLAVVESAADAALVDAISGRLFIADQPALRPSPATIAPQPYAAVVRIDDVRLLAEVNEALTALRADGRLDTIVDRWLDGTAVP